MHRIRNRNFGFTLIELLVVIAIIGLLASVVLASLQLARAKARDAKRVSDLQEMSKLIILRDRDLNPPELNESLPGNNSCTTPAYSDVRDCVNPVDLTYYVDPYGISGGVCDKNSNAPCQYGIANASGHTHATTQDYEICTYLETGLNFGNSGRYKISSSNNSITSGCN